MDKLIITPKTKVFDLLDAYPELEEVLIKEAPQFKKLQNPLLRKTVAKITSISQAAIIGGVDVEALVNKLRGIVGQSNLESGDESNVKYTVNQPKWFSEDKIKEEIDTREMLNAGEHPVHEVLAAIKKLNEGEILKTITPFIAAPLIDKSLSLEYKHWLKKISETEYFIYFTK